jgi:phospholipid transport system transporter-binding protein
MSDRSQQGAVLGSLGSGRFSVNGVIDHAAAARLYRQREELFANSEDPLVDLAGVTSANSAAIALFVEWLGEAGRRQRTLRLLNLPDSLIAIARLGGVSALLAVDDSA